MHKKMKLFMVIAAVLLISVCIIVSTTGEKYKKSSEMREMRELLGKYNISLKEAETLFLPAQKGLGSYFDLPKRLKPTVITDGKDQKLVIAPLAADVMKDPRVKNMKSGEISPDKSIIVEKFDFGKLPIPSPTPRTPRFRRGFSLPPRVLETEIDLVTRLRDERLRRTRTRNETSGDLSYIVVIDDEEPDVWSEGARGLLLVPEENSIYMGNKGTLNRFNVSPGTISFSLTSIENPQSVGRPHCYYGNAYGFGQPTKFVLERGNIGGLKTFVMAPILCNDGSSRLELYRPSRMDLIKTVEIPREFGNPKWVAHDPVTNYTVMPLSDTTLGLFSIFLNGTDLDIVKVLDCPIISGSTIKNVTAGTFRDDGMLYLTSNEDNSKRGIYKLGFTTSNQFQLIAAYRDFVNDQLVGITTYKRDIFLMIRNNDFGDDNISIYRFTEALPNEFSWGNAAQVLTHKGMTVTLGRIKNQGMCGSCWAFATIEAMGDRYNIAKGTSHNFSASRLILCDKWRGHCNGGVPQWTTDFLAEKGTVLESCWDYNWCLSDANCSGGGTAVAGSEFDAENVNEESLLNMSASCLTYQNKCMSCDNSSGTKVCTEVTDSNGRPQKPFAYKIFGESLRYLNNQKQMMLDIYTNGPIIASFAVYENMYTDWGMYTATDGIYCNYDDYNVYGIRTDSFGQIWSNEHIGDHVIEIIGWGERTIPDIRRRARGVTGAVMTVKYWIIKNSWGSSFGGFDGFWRVAFSDPETGLNEMIRMDNPIVINLGIYRENIYGAMSMLPDTNCPCPYDQCTYKCTNLTLDKKCPNQAWEYTNELCWYD